MRPGVRLHGPIDDQLVPVVDPCVNHAIAGHPKQECRKRVEDQNLIKVDATLLVILRWAREASVDALAHVDQLERR